MLKVKELKKEIKNNFDFIRLVSSDLTLSGINLINLNTAQASQRAKEIGVRKAIGGSRFGVVLQFCSKMQ
jgi:ABC-type antimicrobial peptide transport system permease subunit